MKSAQAHQAAMNRRRELVLIQQEKSAAVDRYFDQWEKITTRYENWTAPEYYKAAEDNAIKERNHKLKIANLEKRRGKLRTLLDTENTQYKSEIEELTRPKSKRYSTNILNDIVTNIHQTKTEKYRTDLESKLYGKWRYGLSPDREKILFESKNENIAMAKLSWLDKQVELHLQKEQCAKESEERKLKLEQERRKHEEFLTKTRESRELEIKELRSMQENHMHELKLREDDGNRLKNNEELLNCHKQELEDLLKLVESNFLKRKDQSVIYFNIRKIKMLFRKRSNEIQNDLQEDITVLQKMVKLNASEKIISVLQKFERQLVIERERQKLIECMYESEVKCQLIKQQSQWTEEISVREILLKNVIVDELESVTKKCAKCIEEQKYLLDVRQSLLTAISDLNDRLKTLMHEENVFSKSNVYDVDENLEKVECKVIKKDDGGRLEPPRFGRKKVAWV